MIRLFDPILPDVELIKSSVDEIFSTGQLTNFGKYCCLFEEKVREFVGCKYVISTPSCDTALKMCVYALGMKKIVIPTFTFNSTWMASEWNAGMFFLSDIDSETLLIDLNTIENYAKKGWTDFILVNVFGNMYDIDSLNFLKNKYNLNILFDSAHSFGSTYKDIKSGNLGYTECFSFSATKVITSGEGGMICTNDFALYEKLKYIRNYGFQGDYNSIYRGCNGKMSEMNAIVGYHSMNIFEDVLIKKRNVVLSLKEKLKNKFRFQKITSGVQSCYKDFILLEVDYPCLSKVFQDKQIPHKRYFLPLHKQDEIRRYMQDASFPNAEKVYNSSVCIPAHAKLTTEEVEKICTTLNNI